MKKLILFISSIIITTNVISQVSKDSIWRKDLVGVWQEFTPIGGNGYQQIYIFFENGTFKLVTNSWYATSANGGFKGHYKVKKGTQTLSVTIDSTIDKTDCYYSYADEPGIYADWILECPNVIIKPYNKPENTFEIPIEWTVPDKEFDCWDKPLKCILMNKDFKYYKLGDEPLNE